MTVYVDNMKTSYGCMKMCHMAADSNQELLEMVDKIGVSKKWIQYPNTWKEHFDICLSKRILAIKEGAREIDSRELVRNVMKIKQT